MLSLDVLRSERVLSSGGDRACRVWKIPEESQLLYRCVYVCECICVYVCECIGVCVYVYVCGWGVGGGGRGVELNLDLGVLQFLECVSVWGVCVWLGLGLGVKFGVCSLQSPVCVCVGWWRGVGEFRGLQSPVCVCVGGCG